MADFPRNRLVQVEEAVAVPTATTNASVQECLRDIENVLTDCHEQLSRIQGSHPTAEKQKGDGILYTVDRITSSVRELQGDLQALANRLGSL